MYDYDLMLWILISLIYGVCMFRYGRKRAYPTIYFAFVIITGIYVNKLLEVAFFPFWADGTRYFQSTADYVDLGLDFSILSGWQCVGNVIMTMPIGILLAFVADWSNRRRVIITVVVSAAIEFIQLLTILLLHRVDTIFDVKDIILNLAGGLLGLGLFYMFCAVAGGTRRKGQNHRNLTGFLLLVAANCRENRSSLCGAGQPEQAHCTGGI